MNYYRYKNFTTTGQEKKQNLSDKLLLVLSINLKKILYISFPSIEVEKFLWAQSNEFKLDLKHFQPLVALDSNT